MTYYREYKGLNSRSIEWYGKKVISLRYQISEIVRIASVDDLDRCVDVLFLNGYEWIARERQNQSTELDQILLLLIIQNEMNKSLFIYLIKIES